MNQIPLTMLGAISAFELSMINERWAEGQAMAKADGKHMGRVAKPSAAQAPLRTHAAAGESKTALAEEYEISRATV